MKEIVIPGEVDLASEGSIYFEHIEQLQPEGQERLLRLILEGKVARSGDGNMEDSIDVRVMCSSTTDLTRMMEDGKIKKELWQHLSQAQLLVPPLRDRKEDILSLVDKFVQKYCETHHKPVRQISQEAKELLYAYDWPGNIREVENVIERAVLLARGDEIQPENLLINIVRLREQDAGLKLLSLEAMEKQHIGRVLEYTNWNKTRASQILGINRKTLLEKRKKYNLK